MQKLIKECIVRRQRLAEQLPNNAMLVLAGAKTQYRNADAEYKFRQESNLYYFTGLKAPESILIVLKTAQDITSIVFTPAKNLQLEVWSGVRESSTEIVKNYAVQESYYLPDFVGKAQELLAKVNQVFLLSTDTSLNSQFKKIINNYHKLNKLKKSKIKISQADDYIKKLRLYKSDYELDLIQQAVDVTVAAHKQLIREAEPGMNEHDLEVVFRQHCLQAGIIEMAYHPIVAAGSNACTLHYLDNSQIINGQDLILVDAGCENNYYAADLTRTFPANGKFSKEQSIIYNICLKAQQAAIDLIKPGATFLQLEQKIVEIITSALLELGILQGSLAECISEKHYKEFYMHSCGHWLGLDVHDFASYYNDHQPIEFAPNMVLTIEPGIYLRAQTSLAKKWHNIGVRIEDNILVTLDGCKVLSEKLPKEIGKLEELYAS